MIALIGAALIGVVFLTSLLSGIFGMAGGLILLWTLLIVLPVATAIAVHGVIQIVSNISRATYARAHIDWRIMALITSGVLFAAALFYWLRYEPSLSVMMLVVGIMPLLIWIPSSWLSLDASRPHQAVLCGLISGCLTIGVGVAGPIVDMFFFRTDVDRRKIVATKAAVQVLTHTIKVLFYWNSALVLTSSEWLAVLVAAPFTIAGTMSGNRILARMTNANYRFWTRLIITAIGGVFLVRGLLLLASNA